MFRKQTKISFIIDDDNNFYISIDLKKRDELSILKIAKLMSLLECGELHQQIVSAIREDSIKNNSHKYAEQIIDIINKHIKEHKIKNEMEIKSRSLYKRSPVISPDAVLPTFRNSMNA